MDAITIAIVLAAIASTVWLHSFAAADDHGRFPVWPSVFMLAGGVGALAFYFGLEYVMTTVTGVSSAPQPIFGHGPVETIAVLLAGIWMVLFGAATAATRVGINQRSTERELRDLRSQVERLSAQVPTS